MEDDSTGDISSQYPDSELPSQSIDEVGADEEEEEYNGQNDDPPMHERFPVKAMGDDSNIPPLGSIKDNFGENMSGSSKGGAMISVGSKGGATISGGAKGGATISDGAMSSGGAKGGVSKYSDGNEVKGYVWPCQVCADIAGGYHYGAWTCEPCSGFFKKWGEC